MGPANKKQKFRDYTSEAQQQIHLSLDALHHGGGIVRADTLDEISRQFQLNPRARDGMMFFMNRAISRCRALKIYFIEESVVPPKKEEVQGGNPWCEWQWQRYGNIWLLQLAQRLRRNKPPKMDVIVDIVVLIRIGGGSMRTTLIEVDDFLSDRPDRMSQSELRNLVRGELFRQAQDLILSRHGL